jgi:hypothetical protein
MQLLWKGTKMNRFLIYSFVLLLAVVFSHDPAFARGVVRDQGAAGSLDQQYQTDMSLNEALTVHDATSGRLSGKQRSAEDLTAEEEPNQNR